MTDVVKAASELTKMIKAKGYRASVMMRYSEQDGDVCWTGSIYADDCGIGRIFSMKYKTFHGFMWDAREEISKLPDVAEQERKDLIEKYQSARTRLAELGVDLSDL